VIRAAPVVAICALVAATTTAAAYRDGAPPGHTGGFGEPTCGACHFGAAPDDQGRTHIDAPARYAPGETYEIVVSVHHPELNAAGFQLTARFATGRAAGEQAGHLAPSDDRTAVITSAAGIVYAGHTGAGSSPSTGGVGRWSLLWTAPAADQDVVFHLAANAANDDDSDFGDRIYVAQRTVPPADAK
jgi:hypothetical protein